MRGTRKALLMAGGWLAFGLGWLGIFLPGLPTTIFWILAALAFMRTNARMYERLMSHPRFGPGIRLFVEEGRISRKGKLLSIAAMMGFSILGALAIPPIAVKLLVLASASAGSIWVSLLPVTETRVETPRSAEKPEGGSRESAGEVTRS